MPFNCACRTMIFFEFFCGVPRLAFEHGSRRAILGYIIASTNQSAGSVGRAGFAGRAARLSSLIEAARMSHTFATKKLTASFRDYPDYLERGGVYGKTDWIAWILPGKLGNGKNAGG
jgi:hypothetical protein